MMQNPKHSLSTRHGKLSRPLQVLGLSFRRSSSLSATTPLGTQVAKTPTTTWRPNAWQLGGVIAAVFLALISLVWRVCWSVVLVPTYIVKALFSSTPPWRCAPDKIKVTHSQRAQNFHREPHVKDLRRFLKRPTVIHICKCLDT